ncbi:MAG: zinc ribbon domain-containing protein [Candidatus Methanomethylophilaceae archaeon]
MSYYENVGFPEIFLTGMLLALVLLLMLAKRLMARPREKEEEDGGVVPEMKPIRDESVVCQICLGDVDPGCEYRVCACGATFHPVCIDRTGFCPYCSAGFTEAGFHMERTRGDPRDNDDCCPICGRAVFGKICECGALFADESGEIDCPVCGATIPSGEETCARCGESFEIFVPHSCPVCKAIVHEGQRVCRCGLVLDDLCPECGWKLGPLEQACPICGLDFEMVDRDGLL